jgi:hypothetical protein
VGWGWRARKRKVTKVVVIEFYATTKNNKPHTQIT